MTRRAAISRRYAYLVLVGRVEWNLTDLSVLSTILADVSNRQLNTLEKSRLRCIPIALTVNRKTVMNVVQLSSAEGILLLLLLKSN